MPLGVELYSMFQFLDFYIDRSEFCESPILIIENRFSKNYTDLTRRSQDAGCAVRSKIFDSRNSEDRKMPVGLVPVTALPEGRTKVQ